MSVPWREIDENPNVTGGCLCYSANNPDQPKDGGFLNPAREFNDLGHQSPHVFLCKGCPNLPKDLLSPPEPPEVIDGTAVEVTVPVARRETSQRKDAPAKP